MPETHQPLPWNSAEVAEALDRRDVGALFRVAKRYGWSQTALGSRTGMTQGEVSHIAHGRRQVANFDVLLRIADGLGMPDSARRRFGLAPRNTGPDSGSAQVMSATYSEDPRPADTVSVRSAPSSAQTYRDTPDTARQESEEMKRRTLLRSLVLGAGLSPTALAAVDASRRAAMDVFAPAAVDGTSVDAWNRRVRTYAEAYQNAPPAELLGSVVLDFMEVSAHLRDQRSAPVRSTACSLAAQFAGLAGVFLSALGRDVDAQAWFRTGRLAADETPDDALRAWITARSAVVALYYGTPATALALADEAAATLGDSVSPTAPRISVIRARALARLGLAQPARSELSRAEGLALCFEEAEGIDTAFGYTQRQFHAHVGNALTHLGDTARAAEHQALALRLYAGTTEQLDPVLVQFDSARCLIHDGDIDEGATKAVQILAGLPTGHRTGMVLSYARDVARTIPEHHRSRAPARDLGEVLAATAV